MKSAKRFAAVWLLTVLVGVVPVYAQTTPPAAPLPVQATPAAPAQLPTGARIAFVNVQVVFTESALGKKGQERWRVLNDKLFAGLSARQKEIQGLTEKIQTQRSLIDDAVLKQWNLDLARLQREAQFAQQEAQVQSEQMQQDVLAEFEKQILPVIDAIRLEKKLDAILAIQSEPGGLTLLAIDPGLDLSQEVVKRLNAMKL